MDDQEAIQGDWVSIAPGKEGYRIPIGPELIGSKLRYRLNADVSPKQIDVEHRDPGARPRFFAHGIYDLTDNLLTIHWSDGSKRPRQFPDPGEGNARMLRLRRTH